MKRILVTEGRFDAIVLRTLLAAANRDEIEIFHGSGKSAAISLGNSFALNKSAKVAIVVDADTSVPERLAEQQLIFRDLQQQSYGEYGARLFLAVPTLEAALFPTAEDFESTFNLEFTPKQREVYAQDWKMSVRAFLTVPQANTTPTIRTKGVRPEMLRKILRKTPLSELLKFLGS